MAGPSSCARRAWQHLVLERAVAVFTLGWPDETEEVTRDGAHHPGAVLVTGSTSSSSGWRMMMRYARHGREGAVPRRLYPRPCPRREGPENRSQGQCDGPAGPDRPVWRHALYPDGDGRPSRDIKMSTTRLESYRNFTTKIWNTCRFLQMNGCRRAGEFDLARSRSRSTAGSSQNTTRPSTRPGRDRGLPFQRGGGRADSFVAFIATGIELIKPQLDGDATETRATAAAILPDRCACHIPSCRI